MPPLATAKICCHTVGAECSTRKFVFDSGPAAATAAPTCHLRRTCVVTASSRRRHHRCDLVVVCAGAAAGDGHPGAPPADVAGCRGGRGRGRGGGGAAAAAAAFGGASPPLAPRAAVAAGSRPGSGACPVVRLRENTGGEPPTQRAARRRLRRPSAPLSEISAAAAAAAAGLGRK